MGEGVKRGKEEEEEVVMLMEDPAAAAEEEDVEVVEEGDGVMRLERFLLKMPVRVLLVEGDDSTRQIIAALLRKCSYRVTAASDGVKAWEMLKEKSYCIDLVLTEVDLPLMSGFGLLSMIMEHETCKNIPVIMMSSHDSVSMVFKCMLKGASDFLVKPIRKNELRNLWQHVWRRQIASGRPSGTLGYQDENHAKHEIGAESKKGKVSKENVACMQDNKECSDQGSDARSSCTRSDMEAESRRVENFVEHKLSSNEDPSLVDQSCEERIQLDSSLAMYGPKVEAARKEDVMRSTFPDHKDNICEKASEEVVDLIREIDNQPKHKNTQRDAYSIQNTQENCINFATSPFPHLELSLRRFEYSSANKTENDERNTLNHSTSSAFSLYSSRNVAASTSASDAPGCSGTKSNPNFEEAHKVQDGKVQDGKAVRCSPIRVLPFPIPIGGISLDSMVNDCGPLMQPLFYPHSSHPFWSHSQSICQEATMPTSSSNQSEPKNVNSIQVEGKDNQSVKSPAHHSVQIQEETSQHLDVEKHMSSAAVESGSSFCNSGRNPSESAGQAISESANNEGIFTHKENKLAEIHCLSPREVALNKFRLKRKDRCFEKKVRYQSRKILAEQRPRVKGQFVRRDQAFVQCMEAGSHRSESIT
ncbi:two-component response regulator-like PRR95 isoform X1 [Ananas comosus]|uniref:Two-component response regulator-like PRR95 isoform X1 n=1 Tax=Ananas comosus TaxID=4615 RepID=A0A6P5H9B7_ANACO|nr:two-component response regulator-like PRR95 isoform X1 [Ananas comosus]